VWRSRDFVAPLARALTEICIALDALLLPALQTVLIFDHLEPQAHNVKLHTKWRVVCAVKHARHHGGLFFTASSRRTLPRRLIGCRVEIVRRLLGARPVRSPVARGAQHLATVAVRALDRIELLGERCVVCVAVILVLGRRCTASTTTTTTNAPFAPCRSTPAPPRAPRRAARHDSRPRAAPSSSRRWLD
jgi:hypothetical protein